MTNIVLTVIGDDREGLVTEISQVVEDHGGNWLDSQLGRLAGTFAGIVLVDVEAERAEDLEEAVGSLLDADGWTVRTRRADGAAADAPSTEPPLRLHLLGQDRPGMVHEISAALTSQHARYQEFRSWTSAAPEGGGVLFQAEAVVRLAGNTDQADLREALEKIAAELMVDIEIDADGHENDS